MQQAWHFVSESNTLTASTYSYLTSPSDTAMMRASSRCGQLTNTAFPNTCVATSSHTLKPKKEKKTRQERERRYIWIYIWYSVNGLKQNKLKLSLLFFKWRLCYEKISQLQNSALLMRRFSHIVYSITIEMFAHCWGDLLHVVPLTIWYKSIIGDICDFSLAPSRGNLYHCSIQWRKT